MPKRSLSIGLMAVAAAAVVLPLQAHANHENRYFGFSTGYQPYPYYYPPPAYAPPPPRVRQSAPGVYEYEVAPGHWVRTYPGYGNQPPPQRDRRVRSRPQGPAALRSTEPPPIPVRKPELAGEPSEPTGPVQSAPATRSTTESPAAATNRATASIAQSAPATDPAGRLSCESASDIIKGFGFSDVRANSCSGQEYDFSAARDGNDYDIKLSAANGELTEVRKR